MSEIRSSDAPLAELGEQLRQERLVVFLKGQGLKRVEALRLFSGIARVVAEQEMERAQKGDRYQVEWKRRYNDAGSLSWTVFTLPLALIHLWHPRDKEIIFTTEHRLRAEDAADYRLQRFAGSCLQVFSGVLVFAALVHLAGSVAVAGVESHLWWAYAYLVIAALLVWGAIGFYRWSKRFAIPKPLRMYSANGLFEYGGLKRVAGRI